jgi:hypothetical protein
MEQVRLRSARGNVCADAAGRRYSDNTLSKQRGRPNSKGGHGGKDIGRESVRTLLYTVNALLFAGLRQRIGSRSAETAERGCKPVKTVENKKNAP